MNTMPFTQQKKLFDRLSSVASYANLNREEKRAYDADLKAYRDMVGQLSFAEERGIEKGLERGRAEGRAEEHRTIIRQLFDNGLSVDIIAGSLNLPVETVKSYLDL